MITLTKDQIEPLFDFARATSAIEQAYRDTSRGLVNLPPVGHITFPESADCHIKYGHVQGAANFVIKIATGMPENAAVGLPSGNGLSLVLSAKTGAVQAILHDEMMLTDLRTGIGGAIATRALARKDAQNILVVGTSIQAHQQILAHRALLGDRSAFTIWGRDAAKARALALQLACDATTDLQAACVRADVIVTATGATTALIHSDWVRPGTHITAVGADAPGKQELDPNLVAWAHILVADLTAQCLDHGEISHAYQAGLIARDKPIELGHLLDDPNLGRQTQAQITIADLTGIAAQDIAIAQVILAAHQRETA